MCCVQCCGCPWLSTNLSLYCSFWLNSINDSPPCQHLRHSIFISRLTSAASSGACFSSYHDTWKYRFQVLASTLKSSKMHVLESYYGPCDMMFIYIIDSHGNYLSYSVHKYLGWKWQLQLVFFQQYTDILYHLDMHLWTNKRGGIYQ